MPAALWSYVFLSYLVHSASSQDYAQLTFSVNPVYIGNSVTLTCSHYMTEYSLSQATIEAFNGSLNSGTLSFTVGNVDITANGVFDGSSFVGFPNITVQAMSVSVTLAVTPSLELNYSCNLQMTVVSYNSYDYSYSTDTTVLTSPAYFLQVRVQPLPPVFTQNSLVFTEYDQGVSVQCVSSFGRPAAIVTISATSPLGRVSSATDSETTSLTLPTPLTDWHEAVVICSVTNHNLANMMVSKSIFITLLPLPPVFTQNPLIFNETGNAAISCESISGRPAATVTLTVTSPSGMMATITGFETVTLTLPPPLTEWHLATANCSVANFNLANNIILSSIFVNFIMRTGMPDDVNTTANGTELDCSIYTISYPGAQYQWSVPQESYVSNRSLLSSALFSVERVQTGIFNCTATNVVTLKDLKVVFNLSSLPQLSTNLMIVSNSTCEQCWIIAPIASRLVIFTIFLAMMFTGVCLTKRDSSILISFEEKSDPLSRKPCKVTNASVETANLDYESLNAQLFGEPTYAQLVMAKPLDEGVEYENIGYRTEHLPAS